MEPLESLPPSPPATDAVAATAAAEPTRSAWRPGRMTSGIVAGGAAFAMVLAGLGIANAQTDDTPPTSAPAAASAENPAPRSHDGDHEGRHPGIKARLSVVATALGVSEDELRTQLEAGKTIAAIAADKGVDVNKVIAALVDAAKTHLAEEVTAGEITQAQADARIATLPARITEMVNNPRPAGDHDGKGGPGREGMKMSLSVAAKALGISDDELRTQLQAGKTIADVAKDKGVDVNKVIAALVDAAKTHLAQEVTDGRITQAQADERIANLTPRITEHVNNPRPAGDHDGKGGPGREGMKMSLSVAAKALGVSDDELRTQLQAGKTIADVAKDKGVDVNTVIGALVDAAKTHLAQEVTDGRITQAQADERIANLTPRITEHVNNPRPPRGDHRGPRGADDGDRPASDGSPEAAPATFDA